MNPIATPDVYGELTEPLTLRIQRLLPGPVDRVWAYLTEGELRRQWLAAGDMTLQVGAPFEFVWRNDELADEPAQRPEGFPEEQRMQSRITEVDAPRLLSFNWHGSGDVTFELEEQGDGVLLTVTHRRLPARKTLVGVAAGWHVHLDILGGRLVGSRIEPFWVGWRRVREEYESRLPT